MKEYTVRFVREGVTVTAREGETLRAAALRAGILLDAPCGGRGSCGKCLVRANGTACLACRTEVTEDLTVETPFPEETEILTDGAPVRTRPDGAHALALAYDIGTTTVVCSLLDGRSGAVLARAGALNPQTRFGADVVSRLEYVCKTGSDEPRRAIRETMAELALETAREAGLDPVRVTLAAVVGNPAMHHLLLGIDPTPLTVPPYRPAVTEALELPADFLPIAPGAVLRVLPNVGGFVGADTVGCMTALRFDRFDDPVLLLDVGTNGEMVLSAGGRRLACSTAAGPALEGARISCGMRGAPGAVEHVRLEDGAVRFRVIGGGAARGLCGSGLIDLAAVLLERGLISESGRLREPYRLGDTEVVLTQRDVRELQLAKAAIRAGADLMTARLGLRTEDISRVFLAGAFGTHLDPDSACRIGLLPPALAGRITAVGNAAGEGARLCALSAAELEYARRLAAETELLELASLPQFQDAFVDRLDFSEPDPIPPL